MLGFKVGDNKIVLLNKDKEELRSIYPVNSIPEQLFKSVFTKSSVSPVNQMNFLAKNYRFKCENCANLCGIFFYLEIKRTEEFLKSSLVICDDCFKNDQIKESPRYSKENFECTSIFNLLNNHECKLLYYLFIIIQSEGTRSKPEDS